MMAYGETERIGGMPCWRFCGDRELMRVPDDLRKCVSFIQARWGDSPFVGSAFFVGVPLGITEQVVDDNIVTYVVTAKHCIVNKDGIADEVLLRLNTRTGGSETIATDPHAWLLHPSADVAVLLVGLNSSVFDYRVYPAANAATEELIADREVGPGDDVFITGLLVHHPGSTRAMPIVRLGSVAGLPEDPVLLDTGDKDAEDIVTLLEVHSIGGLSGSPVFLHLPFWRDTEKGDLIVGIGGKAGSGGQTWLLGVMHGFYPVGKNDPDRVSGGNENLNTGIAVVVRVDRVLDLVDHPDQVRFRDMAMKQLIGSQLPKPGATGDLETRSP